MSESQNDSSRAVARGRVELTAALLFIGAALIMATVCGAVIISGWFAGVIEDRAERVFWAGAILAGVAVTILGVAAIPGGDDDTRVIRRTRLLLRTGLVCFLIAPALCVGALIANFYRF